MKTLSVCILFASLSLPAVEAAPEKTITSTTESRGEQVIIPPFDLDDDDILRMKEKVQKIKPLLEKDRELAYTRVRDIYEIPGIVPRINLAYGYGTVINLPYTFNGSNIATGALEKFHVEVKGSSLIIFPVKEFKSTNIIVFEDAGNAMVPHHYLLIEDSASGGADLTVNIKRGSSGTVPDTIDAMVRVITTQRVPEKGTNESILLAGRSPSLTNLTGYPFVRMMKLTQPDLYVFMIAQRVTPVGHAEFWVNTGTGTTIVASRSSKITVRRIIDGKTLSNID